MKKEEQPTDKSGTLRPLNLAASLQPITAVQSQNTSTFKAELTSGRLWAIGFPEKSWIQTINIIFSAEVGVNGNGAFL